MKPPKHVSRNVQEEIIDAACEAIAGNKALRRTISSALLLGFDEAVDSVRQEIKQKAEAIRVTSSVMNLSDGFLELRVHTGSNMTTINLVDHIENAIVGAKEISDPKAIARALAGVESFLDLLAELKSALDERHKTLMQDSELLRTKQESLPHAR